jgi:hypothetical protein
MSRFLSDSDIYRFWSNVTDLNCSDLRRNENRAFVFGYWIGYN